MAGSLFLTWPFQQFKTVDSGKFEFVDQVENSTYFYTKKFSKKN